MSRKAELADEPHIENLLEKYSSQSDLTVLALGSSYWTPPDEALLDTIQQIQSDVNPSTSSLIPYFLIYSSRRYIDMVIF